MKAILWLLGILTFILASIYTLLFTPVGNGITAPIIESKINSHSPIKVSMSNFVLNMSGFDIKIDIDEKNNITANGGYSLFNKSVDAKYTLKINDLSKFSTLANRDLSGKISTSGQMIGNIDKINIDGIINIADNDKGDYKISIIDSKPENALLNISNASISQLLKMAGEKNYLSGNLSIVSKIDNLDMNNLKGKSDLFITDGSVNTKNMLRDFNLTLPKTDFKLTFNANLDQNIDYDLKLLSNLAKITSSGLVNPKTLRIDSNYLVDISRLELLKAVTNSPLRGKLKLQGDIKGDKEKLNVNLKSNIAKSKTKVGIVLSEFKPKSLQGNISKLHLDELLYTIGQPKYAKAMIDINLDIDNANIKNLNGKVFTNITNGILNNTMIKKDFNITTGKYNKFTSQINTLLNKDEIINNIKLAQDMLSLNSKKAVFNLSNNSFKSDFTVNIADLNKLKPLTNKSMRGSFKFKGDIVKEKDLIVNAASKTLGGTLDIKLKNDDLNANMSNIDTIKTLWTLIYPEIFKGKLNAKAYYNLKDQKGNFAADLKNGHFTRNQMTDLIKQFTKVDMMHENFSQADIKGTINKEHIHSNIFFRSSNASIKGDNIYFNHKSKKIDAKLACNISKYPIGFKITGTVPNVDVKTDAKKIVEQKAKKIIEKEVEKKLKEKIEKDVLDSFMKKLF